MGVVWVAYGDKRIELMNSRGEVCADTLLVAPNSRCIQALHSLHKRGNVTISAFRCPPAEDSGLNDKGKAEENPEEWVLGFELLDTVFSSLPLHLTLVEVLRWVLDDPVQLSDEDEQGQVEELLRHTQHAQPDHIVNTSDWNAPADLVTSLRGYQKQVYMRLEVCNE